MLHYTVANTFGTETDDGKEIFAVRHDTVTTLLTPTYETPNDSYQVGDIVAVWNTPHNEVGTTPDWVGVVNKYGELVELAARYRDWVAL